ncbi:uncharacterized protein LOC144665345 [Oculina patagonica]
MADNSAKVVKMARILAIVHIIVGFLLFCLGIADRLTPAYDYFGSPGEICIGIWTGVWMCIAGGLGIPGTRKKRNLSRNAFAGIFMAFSITSAVFGGVTIIFYSLFSIFEYQQFHRQWWRSYEEEELTREIALTGTIFALGIVEFATGICASVCVCLMRPCKCCYGDPPQQEEDEGQVMYAANTGHVMTEGPGGVPVAIPMQTGGDMVAVQTVTPGPQGGQPQIFMVPVSGAGSYQPQLAQAAPPGAITTAYQPQLTQVAPAGAMVTGYQPQHAEMPPSYGQGQYMTPNNAQGPVKT